MRIVILPSGDAVWPTDLLSVRVQPHPSLEDQEEPRFSVVVNLREADPVMVGQHLTRTAARELAEACGRRINEALTGGAEDQLATAAS